MTVAVAGRALAGVGPGDHACCSFGSDDEQAALVGRFASQAVARHERLIYLADHTDEASIRSYLDVAGIDTNSCLRSGQIELRFFRDTGMADESFDAERHIAGWEAEKARAKADGFSALAATGEMSFAVRRPLETDEVVLYEREVTRIFSAADVTGLCLYDTRLFPDQLLSRLVGVHEFRIALDPDGSTVTRGAVSVAEPSAGELAVSGEVDVAVEEYLWSRFEEHLFDEGDVVIDVGEVSFIDVSGCRTLFRAAKALRDGRRLVLANPRRQLVRTLSLCGWADHPRIVLDGGSTPGPAAKRGCA